MYYIIQERNITCILDTVELTLKSLNSNKTYNIHINMLTEKPDYKLSDNVYVRFIIDERGNTKTFNDGKILNKFRSKKNLENFLKSVDNVQNIQYNTSIKKQDNTTTKQSEVKTMNQFLKQAMTQVTNNPYAGLTKVKAVDLLNNFKTITIIGFDRSQDTNGNPAYRCRIEEDPNVYFYATSELKSMFTIALKSATVEQLSEELPIKFDIEPTTVEYNNQTYPAVKYSIHQEPTIA